MTETSKSKAGQDEGAERPARGIALALAAWAVPGLGHLLMWRWGKAVVYFLCVGGLACAGLAMRGVVFTVSATDVLDRLGFFADLGAGAFYFMTHMIERAGPNVAYAAGDYGTRLFAAAGILNLLAVLEAFDIGRGRRT